MNIIERAKQIILKPNEEWAVIEQETTDVKELVKSYLIPLALIGALASFIGYGLFYKIHSLRLGIESGIMFFLIFIGSSLLSAWVIDTLAPSFGSTKDFRKAFQLIVYSYTPMMVAAVVLIFPSLEWIMTLSGIYSLYILYLGFKPMLKTPDDKVMIYFIVSLVVILIAYFLLRNVLSRLIIGSALTNPPGL